MSQLKSDRILSSNFKLEQDTVLKGASQPENLFYRRSAKFEIKQKCFVPVGYDGMHGTTNVEHPLRACGANHQCLPRARQISTYMLQKLKE